MKNNTNIVRMKNAIVRHWFRTVCSSPPLQASQLEQSTLGSELYSWQSDVAGEGEGAGEESVELVTPEFRQVGGLRQQPL